ncbi:MAG: hypothetical protein E7167_04450 [Firmicutes bacterium]|nr:hypothetical protein [Bacillota bacterium]
MFPRTGNGLSFIKILGGISKSLQIAQEIIPIYEQTKPMIQNAQKAFSSLKKINIPKTGNLDQTTLNLTNKKTITQRNSSINNPQFFR